MNFSSRLEHAWTQQNSLLCVGLDPDLAQMPAHLHHHDACTQIDFFCRDMIDACAPYVCAFKPQIAYFASVHAESVLEKLCGYIKQHYPHIALILDAKRGDIGSTATHYAREAFERYHADAVTLNPYMGLDSIAPFLQYADKGVFLLCRTSNPGGTDIQGLRLENGRLLYEHLAHTIAQVWDTNHQCGVVVGATFPEELARVRALAPNLPILAPGVGAQGGDIAATVAAACDSKGLGLIINSSRAILYASSGTDFARAAASAAQTSRDAINVCR